MALELSADKLLLLISGVELALVIEELMLLGWVLRKLVIGVDVVVARVLVLALVTVVVVVVAMIIVVVR